MLLRHHYCYWMSLLTPPFASVEQHVFFNFTINSIHYFMLSVCKSHTLPPTFVAYTHWLPSPTISKAVVQLQGSVLWPSSFAFICLANSSSSVGSGPASALQSPLLWTPALCLTLLERIPAPTSNWQIKNSIKYTSSQIGSLYSHLMWNLICNSRAWEIPLTLPCLSLTRICHLTQPSFHLYAHDH